MESRFIEYQDGYVDTTTGELFTKEVFESIELNGIKRTVLEDEEFRKKQKEMIEYRKSIDEFKVLIDSEFGNYNHLFFNKIGKELAYCFRFLYLCTYADYTNKLYFNRNNAHKDMIKEKYLMDILKLAKTEFYDTKKYLIENEYIKIDDDKGVLINSDLVMRGGIKLKSKDLIDSDNQYVRVFDNAIKELYEKATPKEHKNLGLFVRMLPFINIEHNVLCSNPMEADKKLVEPLRNVDICNELEISKNTSLKLLKYTINKEPVFIKVTGHYKKEAYIVNPKLFYRGSKSLESLKGLIDVFYIGQDTLKK